MYMRLSISRTTQKIPGPFWPDPNDPWNILQQRPSPEVDAAWDRISDTKAFAINEAEASQLGKDLDTLW
jgi:hypothetical protein